MSQYGRLWQRVSDVRAELARGGHVAAETPAEARMRLGNLVKRLEALIEVWEKCEAAMKQCSDD